MFVKTPDMSFKILIAVQFLESAKRSWRHRHRRRRAVLFGFFKTGRFDKAVHQALKPAMKSNGFNG